GRQHMGEVAPAHPWDRSTPATSCTATTPAAMTSPIVRDTIKKLKARRALLQRQVKGPLEEIRQIEDDLKVLEATTRRAPRGANQAVILRAVRNGATTADEVAE